jgi:hypothetical protein
MGRPYSVHGETWNASSALDVDLRWRIILT